MLKLKSVIKNKEQLLATGWVGDAYEHYRNKEVNNGGTCVNTEMIGCIYDGVIKGRTERCKLDEVDETWILYPEMMLLIDQWGFVRDPETLDILMWDAARFDKAACVNGISKDEDSSIRVSVPYDHSVSYTKDGYYYKGVPPTLSRYPYSLTHGGYTPFDFNELKEAFNCPKVYKTTEIESEHESNKNIDELIKTSNIVSQWEDEGYKYILIKSKI
jgi:hypothetical protein